MCCTCKVVVLLIKPIALLTFSSLSPSSILRSSFADDERHSFSVLWLFLALRFHCICSVSFLGFLFVCLLVVFVAFFVVVAVVVVFFFRMSEHIIFNFVFCPSTAVNDSTVH